MGKKRGKIDKKIETVPQAAAAVASYPQPPAMKAEEYLTAYSGYPYTAISAIAQDVASIDLRLYKTTRSQKGDEVTEILNSEAISLLSYCNPFTTGYDMMEGTQIYLELVGEAFWVVLRDGDEVTGKPREIYLLRPDWMKIVPDPKQFIKEYVYMPGGNLGDKVVFKKENVIHFKYFNPTNPFRGRGSIQAGAMPIDIHNFAQDWNRNFFFNNATPSAVFTTEKKYSKQVLDRFLQDWQNSYGGRRNAHKVAFMSGGFKLDKLGLDAKQLDFTGQQNIMRDDVLAVFKVPKTILGLTDDVNRANAESTTRAYMERVVTPRMKKFVGQLNEFYLPMWEKQTENHFFDFVDPSPEDVEQKLKTYESALTHHWMTVNEVRALENLEPLEGGDEIVIAPKEPVDGTDEEKPAEKIMRAKTTPKTKRVKYLVPRILKPKSHMVKIPPKRFKELETERIADDIRDDVRELVGELLKGEPETPKFQKDPKSAWTKEERDSFWRVFATKTEDREAQMKKIMRNLWAEEEQEIILNVDNFKSYAKGRTKGKASSALPPLKDMVKRWVAVLIPFQKQSVFEEGAQTLELLGLGGNLDMTTASVVQFVRTDGAKLVTGINQTTREKLQSVIAEGLAKEESIQQIKARIRSAFEQFSTVRADMIARSEVIRAANFAAEEAYIQSEVVVEKEWLTSRDARVCPHCQSMDGVRKAVGKSFFKKGDKLTNEDQVLDIDLLDIDTPPLHTQCRCTLIPVIKES